MNQQVFKETKLVKFLKKTIKRGLPNQGINPATRAGDRKLEFLVKQLVKKPFISIDQAQIVSDQIAQESFELSQQRSKTNIDKSVVEQLALAGRLSSLVSGLSNVFSDKSKEVKPTLKPEAETPTAEVESQIASSKKTFDKTSEYFGLKEELTADIKIAMKAKDKIRLETIRSIEKAVLEKEVEVPSSGQENLTPEQELTLLVQQAKQRRDSIEQYRQGVEMT